MFLPPNCRCDHSRLGGAGLWQRPLPALKRQKRQKFFASATALIAKGKFYPSGNVAGAMRGVGAIFRLGMLDRIRKTCKMRILFERTRE